ncbi:MAG TPA: Ig-like domain-containing protein, partial [Gemmatimonadales bacterium]
MTSPQDGFVTRASSVGVSGTAFASDGAGPVTVTVNSVAVPVAADGSFGGSVVLSEWGNAITVLAEDALGQVSAVYLNVEQDLLPPSVWFFGAEEGQVLNLDQLTPNCGASDEFIASAQATVNGLPFTCGDTIFGFGTYTFVMDAVDQAGNSAHLSVSFALAMPPQLVLSSPSDGLITNVQSFPVAGIATASPGAGPVTVSINGVGVPVAADGSFTGTAALQEGWQLVDVEATDAFGQTTTLIPQVVLDTVPPDVYFQIEDGWVTTDSFVPICGGSDSNLVSLQATLDGEPFICGSMVSAEGSHTLSVAATDAAGNHSEVMNTFAIDRTPPQISISGVADGVTVVAPVSVQVISADAHPLDTTVILDGEVVGEAFTITQSGPHVLRVDSTDLVFNCSVVELHFTVDPEDLAATIVSPVDGMITSNPIAEVVVAINAGHPISQATANGVQLAPQPDGLYHANVSLVEGVNEVQVVVVDSTCAQLVRVVTVVLSSGATALVAQIASSATAGQPLSLVLRALDGLGNVATSYRGSVHLTSTDSQALLPGDYTFTATDAGEHSFVNGIIFRTAGVQALSATDGTLSASQAGIAVSAGAAAQLILSGIPSPIAAGATTSFNLEVTDSFANPATSYTGT